MNKFLLKNKYFLLIFFTIVIACKHSETEKILNSLVGQRVILPKNMIVLKENLIYYNDTFNLIKKDLKIITHIYGSCGVCINNLNKWKNVLDTLKDFKNISLLFIVYTDNIDYFKKLFYPEIKLNYPLIIDTLNFFYKSNKLYNYENIHYQTFLVDKDNKIILVGNPAISQKVRDLYLKTIKNYNLSRNR